jgi:hypothetical protein
VYEFVDDNDDQDELPDWTRWYKGPTTNTRFGRNLKTDDAVFPGLDEDNDDIPDFNRNFNNMPDYAEPFLRYEVDPPDFLFGLDMNNNGVIDRFEDDNQADLPYKKGHRGYNAYLGVELFPESSLMVGRLDEGLLMTDRTNTSHYLLLTLKKEFPERDLSIWFIENPRKVQDDIADDVFQWVEETGSRGESRLITDPLMAQDAFLNTAYLEVKYDRFLPFTTKVKHDVVHLLTDEAGLRDRRYFGVVNKAEYSRELRRWTLLPRWKQLFSSVTPTAEEELKTRELTEIASFMVKRDISTSIRLTAGAEYEVFANLKKRPDPLPAGYLEDYNTWILAAQLANTSPYLGYQITTNVGMQWKRRDEAKSKASSELYSFITVYAGLGTEK